MKFLLKKTQCISAKLGKFSRLKKVSRIYDFVHQLLHFAPLLLLNLGGYSTVLGVSCVSYIWHKGKLLFSCCLHTEKVCVFKSLKDGSILSVKIGFVYFTFLLPEGIIEKSKKVLCSSQYYSETLCSLTKLTEEKWWRADLFSSLHSISFLYTLWISKPTIDHFMQPPLLNQMNRYTYSIGVPQCHICHLFAIWLCRFLHSVGKSSKLSHCHDKVKWDFLSYFPNNVMRVL